MMLIFSYMILYFLPLSFVEVALISTEIQLPYGKIRGEIATTDQGTEYYAFKGIPYAAPPVDDLRLKPPKEVSKWDGILDVTSDHRICPQFHLFNISTLEEDEDCLYLNIYVPKLNTSTGLPILFWIYGGGFFEGFSSHVLYGPDYFLDENIIFISFNYRLSALGFVSTGDEVLPGNLGLKDQNFALRWVQENIHLFGGDKNKVTIFGQSAGAWSVLYHIISEKSKNLFRAAIANSGTALTPISFIKKPKKLMYDIARHINKNVTEVYTSEDLLMLFKETPWQTLINASFDVFKENVLFLLSSENFGASLESKSNDSFLTNTPYSVLLNGKGSIVPLLTGYTSEEALDVSNSPDFEKILYTLDENPQYLVPASLNIPEDKIDKIQNISKSIKEFYCGENVTFTEKPECVIKLISDSVMIRPAIKTAKLYSKFSKVYFYKFSYDGPLGQFSAAMNDTEKVSHGSDIFYLFKNTFFNVSDYPEDDIKTHRRLVKMWSNFVKDLNPTPIKDDLLDNVSWLPSMVANDPNLKYLDIDKNLVLKENPKTDVIEFWDNLFNEYGIPPFDTY